MSIVVLWNAHASGVVFMMVVAVVVVMVVDFVVVVVVVAVDASLSGSQAVHCPLLTVLCLQEPLQ